MAPGSPPGSSAGRGDRGHLPCSTPARQLPNRGQLLDAVSDSGTVTTSEIFRHRITELREANGDSIRGAARRAGIGASYLHKIEHGGSVPTLTTAERIAQAFGTGVAEMCVEQTTSEMRIR